MAIERSIALLPTDATTTAWYSPIFDADPARSAFDEAIKFFNNNLTADDCKRIWLHDKISISDVEHAVLAAKTTYESRSQQSKARKWLTKLSQRLLHYGNIMDTLANYNPEYLALAWGAMKFLLMAVINHEEMLATLAKAFAQIATVLPRVRIKLLLYPTEQIKLAVSTLYAQIIKFMQRAMNWYLEGKTKHLISSIFRPVELRFKDLLEEIESCSQSVDQLAVSAGQAEQRDMHILLLEIKRNVLENQAANSRLFLDSRRRTCEIQFSQILSFTAATSLPNPEEVFRSSVFLSNRRRLRHKAVVHPSWRSQKLKEWAASKSSSVVIVRGSCLTRHETKDFATEIVVLLRSLKIPVIWTLSAKTEGNLGWRSPIDVLKQLVLQVLHVNHSLLKEQSSTLNAARFQSATTEADWFELLGLVLDGIPQVYIVVDAEILSRDFSSQISWPDTFFKIFEDMAARESKTFVKIVLISFGTSPYVFMSSGSALENITVRIDRDRRDISTRKKLHFRSSGRGPGSEVLRPFLLQSAINSI